MNVECERKTLKLSLIDDKKRGGEGGRFWNFLYIGEAAFISVSIFSFGMARFIVINNV